MTYTIKDIKVFIPTYNRPNFLRQSIQSLVNQTAGCPDITVYNNGILKETSAVIKEFENYGVKEIKSHGGLIECMDAVQEYVDSPYVMFFHDDDILNCKYLEYALRALNTYDNVSAITAKYRDFTNFNQVDLTDAKEEHYFFTSKKQFATYMYLYEGVAMQPTIYKTELFKKHKRETGKYGKFFDWPYLVTFSGLGNFVLFSDEKMFNVRIHKEQWSYDEKSSWTITQLINWHKQFANAMDIYNPKSLGHAIFYSKYQRFINGGYQGLVCEKYKKECPINNFFEKANKEININTKESIYNKTWIYLELQNLVRQFNWRRDFKADIIPEHPISTEDIIFDKIQDLQNMMNVLLDRTNILPSFPKRNKLKDLLKWIFSIKNSPDKRHKVLTILGLKIKWKRKKYAKK